MTNCIPIALRNLHYRYLSAICKLVCGSGHCYPKALYVGADELVSNSGSFSIDGVHGSRRLNRAYSSKQSSLHEFSTNLYKHYVFKRRPLQYIRSIAKTLDFSLIQADILWMTDGVIEFDCKA